MVGMTVAELIAKLRTLPQDAHVATLSDGFWGTIDNVSFNATKFFPNDEADCTGWVLIGDGESS